MGMSKLVGQLLYGDEETVKVLKHIMHQGIITVSKSDPTYIKFSCVYDSESVYVDYDTYTLVNEVIAELKKEGYKVFKLETDFDNELGLLTYSCRKDNLRKREEQNIKDAQALFMNCMQYKLDDPANPTEQEISEFRDYIKEKNNETFNHFESLGEEYRIMEV